MTSVTKEKFYLKAIVYILITIFGLGTWTNISGLWIQLPIMVLVLPESWKLPAKLMLIIDSANIVPITIALVSIIFRLNTARAEVPINFVLLCMSITFAVGYALLWDKVAYLFGIEQSAYLMFLCLFTAIADCLSSVTFIPFLHRYDNIYLNAYFTGEALTALLPALLGIVQGLGDSHCVPLDNKTNATWIEVRHPARFSVRTYFLILTSLPLAALFAFSILQFMKTGQVKHPTKSIKKSKHHQSRVFILMDNIDDIDIIRNTITTINKIEDQITSRAKKAQVKMHFTFEQWMFLLIVFTSSFFLFGVCPGLVTYSLNAYSAKTFHYSIIANTFAYPIMTLIGAFVPELSSRTVGYIFAIHTALFVYIFAAAKMSPCPPLVNSMWGHVIIFLAWILISLSGSYLRILMGNYFRKQGQQRDLVWFSLSTQMGAFVGSLVVFVLINSLKMFHERNMCDNSFICF